MAHSGDNLEERAEMLETTGWLADFPWKEVEAVARYFDASTKQKGVTVFREGDQESYMCLIVRGSVEVVKKDVREQEKVLSVIGRGKVFGEMMLFDGEPRSATIIAAESTVLLTLSRENLQRLTRDDPELAARVLWKLCKLLSQRLRMTSGKLVDYIE